jgi:hypothetical protein
MRKIATLLLLLTGTAFADPAAYHLGFTIENGKDSRHYELSLVDKTCGKVELHAKDLTDEINVCANAISKNVRIDVEWMTREGDREMKIEPRLLVTPGTPATVEGGGEKLTVTVR